MSMSSTQTPASLASSTVADLPSDDEDVNEDTHHGGRAGRLTRIRPSDLSPSAGRQTSLPPASLPPRTAFSLTGNHKPVKSKTKLDKNDFVEDQAQESDDDEIGFGWGPKRKNDADEEEGEDLDATLADLVDDKAMDEDELNSARVMEKHQCVFCLIEC